MKKTFVRSGVRSYLSVLLIPLFSSVIIYGVMFGVLKSTIGNTEYNSFTAITNIAENEFANAFAKTHRIVSQNAYITLCGARSSEEVDDVNFSQVKEPLASITSESSFMEIAAISFPGGFFISDTGTYDDAYFFGKLRDLTGTEEDVLTDLYEQEREKNFVLRPCGNYTLAFICLHGIADSHAVWVIDNIKYAAHMRNFFDYGNCSFSVRSDGSAVLQAESGQITQSDRRHALTATGAETGFEYAYIVGSVNYVGIWAPLWALFSLSILSGGGIGLYLIVKKVQKGYRPIRALREKLSSDDFDDCYNDFTAINESVDKLIEEKDRYQKKVQSHARYFVNNFLTRLLRGLPLPDSPENICREYDIRLLGKKLAVLIIESEELNEQLQVFSEKERTDKRQIIAQERHKIARDCFEKYCGDSVYVVDSEDCNYVILGFDKNKEDDAVFAEIKAAAKVYQAKANETYRIYVSVYCSDLADSLISLSRARRHAEETRAFAALIGGDNEIIFYSQTVSTKYTVSLDIEGYNLFVNCLKEKDFGNAWKQLKQIVETSLTDQPKEILEVRLYSVIDRLVLELNKATTSFDAEYLHGLDFAHKLLSVRSVKKLLSVSEEIFASLDRYERENIGEKTEWIGRVKTYVKEHYAEASLSVGELAERFHFSLSHFSRIFKQEVGAGVFEYIQNIRIEKAKEMLMAGKSTEETAKGVGFLDRGPFIKAFKKIEGTTPSQYRRMGE